MIVSAGWIEPLHKRGICKRVVYSKSVFRRSPRPFLRVRAMRQSPNINQPLFFRQLIEPIRTCEFRTSWSFIPCLIAGIEIAGDQQWMVSVASRCQTADVEISLFRFSLRKIAAEESPLVKLGP